MPKLIPFPGPDPVTCPDCNGRGCRWCAHSGHWQDPRPGDLRSVARLLRAVGKKPRLVAEYETAADRMDGGDKPLTQSAAEARRFDRLVPSRSR